MDEGNQGERPGVSRPRATDPEQRRGEPFLPPFILLLFLSAFLFYSRLGCPLLEPEEARYAEIPREMLQKGSWITPLLHGENYYQKPPLLYWLIMVSYQIFGVHDWSARLVPTTAGILIVLISYAWARRTIGPRAALAGALILCLSGRFLYLEGMVAMDGLLCLWIIGGLACGHLACGGRGARGEGRGPESGWRLLWWMISAVSCGLGLLTKGPVAVILILGPLAAWQLLNCRTQRVRIGSWLLYLGIALSIAGPWYLAAGRRDAQATGEFFWLHNVIRFLAPFDHAKPAWFYVPGLLLGTLPWSLLLIPALRDYFRQRWQLPRGTGLLLIAFCWCVAFFSLSGCKRTGYILPALPILALILGSYLDNAIVWTLRLQTIGLVSVVTMTLGMWWMSHHLLPEYHRHYGMRGLVRRHAGLARDVTVACYPRLWDSVPFYLEREAACFGSAESAQLMEQLQASDTLLFVKNDHSFGEVVDALPANLEFVACGRQGWNVIVGLVRRKREEATKK